MINENTLGDYNIREHSLLDFFLRLRGGPETVQPPIFLPNMNFNSMITLEHHKFASSAPDWRTIGPGISIKGICKNESCICYDDVVAKTLGYGEFDLRNILENLAKCPVCLSVPNFDNILFYKSCWYSKAVLSNGNKVSTKDNPSYTIGNQWATYKGGENSQYQYCRLHVMSHRE